MLILAIIALLVLSLFGVGMMVVSQRQESKRAETGEALGQTAGVPETVLPAAVEVTPEVALVDPPEGSPVVGSGIVEGPTPPQEHAEDLAPLAIHVLAPELVRAPPAPDKRPENAPERAAELTVVKVVETDCEPDERWRLGMRQNLGELGNKVASDAEKYRYFEAEEPEISRLAISAKTRGECATATTRFEILKSRLLP
jgi:hypothetical protein